VRREHAEQFSREMEEYRRALLHYAGASEWDEFKARAGRLFDYVESIEFSEIERRFFHVFSAILAFLILVVMVLFNYDFASNAELLRLKNAFILVALGASSFELYFYLNYRLYMGARTANSRRRREVFIREMIQDFRTSTVRA